MILLTNMNTDKENELDKYVYETIEDDIAVAKNSLRKLSFRYIKDQSTHDKLFVTLWLNVQRLENKLVELQKQMRCKVI